MPVSLPPPLVSVPEIFLATLLALAEVLTKLAKKLAASVKLSQSN